MLRRRIYTTGLGLSALLFLFALTPRTYEIGRFLPEHFHPDEDKEIRRAIQLLRGDVDLSRVHKGGLFAVLSVEYGGLYLFQRLTGQVDSPDDFAIKTIAADPTMLFLLDRWTVALLGAACALLAFRITRRLGGTQAGVLAGLLVALFAPHLELSRVGRLDVPLTFAVLLILDLSLSAYQKPTTRRILILSIAAALCVSIKTSGAPFLLCALPPFWLWLRAARPRARVRRFSTAFAASLATVAIFNPALLAAVAFAGGAAATSNGAGPEFQPVLADQYAGALPGVFENYVIYPYRQLGPLVLVAAILGSFLLLFQGHRRIRASIPLWLTAIGLQVLLLSSLSDLVNWRYVLPGETIVLLLAALGARTFAQRFHSGWPRVAVFSTLAFALVVSLSGAASATLEHDITEPSQVAARKWIDANIPPGTKIAVEGRDVFPSQYMPRIGHTPESLEAAIRRVEKKDRAKADVLRRFFLPSLSSPGYDITLYEYSREVPTLKSLRDAEVRYVVLHRYGFAPDERSEFGQRVRALRDLCESHGIIARRFAPGRELRGEEIFIYELSW